MYPLTFLSFACLLNFVIANSSDASKVSDKYAFRIFNAIHSSMRQFGSSLNHNGISFFPAVVPEGTELYHGDAIKESITGFNWLAFEPEHALMFAHIEKDYSEPGKPNPPPGAPPRRPHPPGQQHMKSEPRIPVDSFRFPDEVPEPGWLHTYRARKDLHLLYIDGMSAGKTINGTLDSQDYLLLNSTRPLFFFDELNRALKLCAIAKNDWHGQVDGFIRMEAGFEILLCDMESGVQEINVVRRRGFEIDIGRGDVQEADDFTYLRAVADRYQGIGWHRVNVNYERMISAWSHSELDFEEHCRCGNGGYPRLTEMTASQIAMLRADVDAELTRYPSPFTQIENTVDWQAIADLIIQRYASRLKFLLSLAVPSDEPPPESALARELERTLAPFIDYDDRNMKHAIKAVQQRCSQHFLPPDYTLNTASRAIVAVSERICFDLIQCVVDLHDSPFGDVSKVTKRLQALVDDLNWTVWKECGKCGADEICWVPIWPWGSQEFWDRPQCANASDVSHSRGFWGRAPRMLSEATGTVPMHVARFWRRQQVAELEDERWDY